MTKPKIKPLRTGDIVVLKTGSPQMVVECISSTTGGVRCVWFAEDDKRQSWFAPETLIRVDPEQPEATE